MVKLREKKPAELVRDAKRFIEQHEGHEVEASSSEPHYFNLWCVTCEEENRLREKTRVKSRSFV